MIHNSSVIDKQAIIGKNVKIGPYCYIGPQVKIKDNVELISHVHIEGNTIVGEDTKIFPFASIGTQPQDLKFKGEKTYIEIGKNNLIREYVTINPGTAGGGKKTIIGDNGFFMVGSHVAHDCLVGNNVVFVNNAVIGGHVEISDFVYLGGQSAVHQYCRIGKHAIIGAGTTIDGDVIPYTSVIGSRGYLSGLNLVGLKRRSFKKDEIKTLRNVYRLLFAPEGTFNERLLEVSETYNKNALVKEILSFLKENLNRPLVHPKLGKH